MSALHFAAYYGRGRCLAALLGAGRGGDAEKVDSIGCSPLLLAVQEGHPCCVRALLAAPGGLNTGKYARGWGSPLVDAVGMGSLEIVELLLGAESIAVNEHVARAEDDACTNEATALHHATTEANDAPTCIKVLEAVLIGGGCRFATRVCRHEGCGGARAGCLWCRMTPRALAKSALTRAVYASGCDYWQLRHCRRHSRGMKGAILAVMLCRQRLDARALPAPAEAHGRGSRASRQRQRRPAALAHLPEEIWLATCAFLRSADFPP